MGGERKPPKMESEIQNCGMASTISSEFSSSTNEGTVRSSSLPSSMSGGTIARKKQKSRNKSYSNIRGLNRSCRKIKIWRCLRMFLASRSPMKKLSTTRRKGKSLTKKIPPNETRVSLTRKSWTCLMNTNIVWRKLTTK